MTQSLTHRLFISAGTVIFIFLGVTALVLNQAFAFSLENIVREKLRLHTYALLAVADNENGVIELPSRVAEQRFNSRSESLIGIVTNTEEKEFWRSVSANDQVFSLPAPPAGEWLFGKAQDGAGKVYFVSSYSTVWPDDRGVKSTFVFTVMEELDYYQENIQSYRNTILVALFLIGIVLLGLQAIILRWGLRPVRGLAEDVDAMGRGESQDLGGDYPKELLRLVANVNLLIDNERRQREKYRDRMADLSHSLKTPLSVLKGLESDIVEQEDTIDRHSLVGSLGRQVEKMRSIIDYQLRRAVSSGHSSSVSAISLAPEVEQILDALDKVYSDKQVSAELQIDTDITLLVDEGDLAELLGNTLDNAYKHCRHRVMAQARRVELADGRSAIQIMIEDDGAGIPADKRDSILKRGVRLDSTHAGQGFGLAIVAEIVSSYQGSVVIGESALGGALFTLELPSRKE